ncbi:MAG: nitrite/sulfite reductase [Chloroflexi bacterium]|nr:nitrite/sulfite reductase [Chloroflexota bacterium]
MTTAVRADKPGRVIAILEEELEDFGTAATAYLGREGEAEDLNFVKFRLRQGVYGQRQPDRQMTRVKLPFGGVTSEQLDAFAVIAEDFAPLRKGHLTTREAVQLHHIPLPRMRDALEIMAAAGLSTREACGNTVRNVTGDAWAGIRSDEPFDVTPYAGAFIRYFVRSELTQLLPRKFKVAFSGSEEDAALTQIHDIGFIPEIREVDGEPRKGFRMVTGGGLSIMAKHAVVLREWVSVDDYLRVSEAVLRIFDGATELRKNLAKARLKFLVHRVGEVEFRRMVDEELTKDWAQDRDFSPESLLYLDDEAADAPPAPTGPAQPSDADRATFEEWARTALRAQRQAGYSAIEVRVPEGDLSPEQFRGLADLLRRYGAGRARTTPWQNIVLRWIPDGSVYTVWKGLQELGLGAAGSLEIEDVVSCPGTDSCKLGITSSMGLNRAVSERVREMAVTDPLTRRILINASGCPNSCGQHHIANIGFHGAAIKSGERQVPAYHVFVGGNRRPGSDLQLGTLLKVRLPAKRVPDAVERFVRLYEAERVDGEEFNDYFARVGRDPFEAAVADLTLPPEFSIESMNEFIDWEREGIYVLERGEGECAV